MDDRQQQVKIGSGLEESRINQDFIDWLNKWGLRILIVVLVIVAGYQGKRYLDVRVDNAMNEAFFDLQEASQINQPAALIEVGDKHKGTAAVRELAYMRAGQMLLLEGTMGLKMGTQDVNAPTPDQVLSEADREQRFSRASELFAEMITQLEDKPARRLILLQALSGRASAELSLRNYDEAEALLERMVEVGERDGYDDLAAFARERLAFWDEIKSAPRIVANAEVPGAGATPTGSGLPSDFPSFPEGAGEVIRAEDFAPGEKEAQQEQPNVRVESFDPEEEGAEDEPAQEPGQGGDGEDEPATDG